MKKIFINDFYTITKKRGGIMLKKQYLSDDTIENKSCQINSDFTLLEQLKLAKNIIDLVYGDIRYNLETKEDEKDYNSLEKISFELAEIIKKNEVE